MDIKALIAIADRVLTDSASLLQQDVSIGTQRL